MRKTFFLAIFEYLSIPKSLGSSVVSYPFKKNCEKKLFLEVVKQITPLRLYRNGMKIEKKSTIFNMSKALNSCNNKAGKFLTNPKNFPINNQVKYFFSISNSFVDLSDYILIISEFPYDFEM